MYHQGCATFTAEEKKRAKMLVDMTNSVEAEGIMAQNELADDDWKIMIKMLIG